MPQTGSGTGTAVASGGDLYGTLTELKQRIAGSDSEPFSDETEAILTAVLTDTSRLIDKHCGDYFGRTSAGVVRYFTARHADVLFLDSIASSTITIETDDGQRTYPHTWASTDFDLEPYNAPELSEPFRRIRVAPRGTKQFPTGIAKGVKVTTTWGWPAVPATIKEVCLLEAHRAYMQSQAPTGVVASEAMGSFAIVPALHSGSKLRLSKYVRVGVR